MKALKILSLSLVSAIASSSDVNAQNIEDKFILVDRAVAIIEKFPNVKLTTSLRDDLNLDNGVKKIGNIIDKEIHPPLPDKNISHHILEITKQLKTQLDSNKFTLGDDKENNDKLKREYKILFHHTLLLFGDTSTPDFDETLLTTFHIQRNKVKQMTALLNLKDEEKNNLKAIKESIDNSNKVLEEIRDALKAQMKLAKETKNDSKKLQAKADLLHRKEVIQKVTPGGDRLAIYFQQLDSACLAETERDIQTLIQEKNLFFRIFKRNHEAERIVKRKLNEQYSITQK